MENLGLDTALWKNRKVFVTGHTGFKGSWLTLWLKTLGCSVSGYALPPALDKNLFNLLEHSAFLKASDYADIRDLKTLTEALQKAQPDVIFHLAAQPLVRASFQDPVGTYSTNVMGTVHLLEAVRSLKKPCAVVIVTTDKCYENREWLWPYRETEAMGGFDPYSSSKGCAELVTAAYRNSFFPLARASEHGVFIASARAGNVIGGGDWAQDRLIPDAMTAFASGQPVFLRNPNAIRPWQHVLEPVSGYLLLAQKLLQKNLACAEAFNFGPEEIDCRSVGEIVTKAAAAWDGAAKARLDTSAQPHEAHFLKLDSSKAKAHLGWRPRWNLDRAILETTHWYRTFEKSPKQIAALTLQQLQTYAQSAGDLK